MKIKLFPCLPKCLYQDVTGNKYVFSYASYACMSYRTATKLDPNIDLSVREIEYIETLWYRYRLMEPTLTQYQWQSDSLAFQEGTLVVG